MPVKKLSKIFFPLSHFYHQLENVINQYGDKGIVQHINYRGPNSLILILLLAICKYMLISKLFLFLSDVVNQNFLQVFSVIKSVELLVKFV